MPPPYVAVARTKPAATTPLLAPWQLNDRLPEVINHQQAPEKPRQGDTPARRARMPMYAVLAKQEKRAVMAYGQAGVVSKTAFALAVGSPQGKSLTFDTRVNINRRESEPYGSRYGVTPVEGDNNKRLLMGV